MLFRFWFFVCLFCFVSNLLSHPHGPTLASDLDKNTHWVECSLAVFIKC